MFRCEPLRDGVGVTNAVTVMPAVACAQGGPPRETPGQREALPTEALERHAEITPKPREAIIRRVLPLLATGQWEVRRRLPADFGDCVRSRETGCVRAEDDRPHSAARAGTDPVADARLKAPSASTSVVGHPDDGQPDPVHEHPGQGPGPLFEGDCQHGSLQPLDEGWRASRFPRPGQFPWAIECHRLMGLNPVLTEADEAELAPIEGTSSDARPTGR